MTSEIRAIRETQRSQKAIEGAGVHLHRAIGFGPPEQYDPFLLLDDFRSDRPDDYIAGFPWHPHRGMETITYVLRGEVVHGDSLGNRGVTGPGGVQWMTGGSGIIHQEMPTGDAAGAMHGFQLWANLPASHKMMEPRYREVKRDEIPRVVDRGGATVAVISGTVGHTVGPVRDVVTAPEYLDVDVPAGATFTHPTTRGHTVVAYVIGGRGVFAPGAPAHGDRTLIWFGDGDRVEVTADGKPVRFLLISGRPIGEPIAWAGPIVMNTQEELDVAFDELDKHTFIKTKGKKP